MYADWIYTSLHLLTPSGSQIYPFPDCLQKKGTKSSLSIFKYGWARCPWGWPTAKGLPAADVCWGKQGLFGRAMLVSCPCSGGFSTHVYM